MSQVNYYRISSSVEYIQSTVTGDIWRINYDTGSVWRTTLTIKDLENCGIPYKKIDSLMTSYLKDNGYTCKFLNLSTIKITKAKEGGMVN